MKFYLKVKQKGKDGMVYHSGREKAFLYKMTRLIKTQNGQKIYIRVSYGMGKNHKGREIELYNDGWFTNERDLMKAYKAFIET